MDITAAVPEWTMEAKREAMQLLRKNAPMLLDRPLQRPSAAQKDFHTKKKLQDLGLLIFDLFDAKLSPLNQKRALPLDTVPQQFSTAFFEQATVLKVKRGQKISEMVPISSETPTPFEKNIIILEDDSELSLIEACSGAKRPSDQAKFRAQSYHFILGKRSKLNLVSYQDWQGIENYSHRSFHLDENAQLNWLDAHTGTNEQSTDNQIFFNEGSKLSLKTLAVAAKQEVNRLKYVAHSPEKGAVEHSAILLDRGTIDIESDFACQRHGLPTESKALQHYLTLHGFDHEAAHIIFYKNHLQPFLSLLPQEYQVEILSRI